VIGLEGGTVIFDGANIVANGGGGGAGANSSASGSGQDGRLDGLQAQGGTGSGGSGGTGGNAGTTGGQQGANHDDGAGGGGGAVGYIVVRTLDIKKMGTNVVSPNETTNP
jgi:hypothetical protein